RQVRCRGIAGQLSIKVVGPSPGRIELNVPQTIPIRPKAVIHSPTASQHRLVVAEGAIGEAETRSPIIFVRIEIIKRGPDLLGGLKRISRKGHRICSRRECSVLEFSAKTSLLLAKSKKVAL